MADGTFVSQSMMAFHHFTRAQAIDFCERAAGVRTVRCDGRVEAADCSARSSWLEECGRFDSEVGAFAQPAADLATLHQTVQFNLSVTLEETAEIDATAIQARECHGAGCEARIAAAGGEGGREEAGGAGGSCRCGMPSLTDSKCHY